MAETKGDITVDVAGFRRQVERFATEYGLEARDVMLVQMRLWVQDLIKTTPPKTYAQGRKAVERDLKKLFVPTRDKAVLEFFADEFSSGVLPPSVSFNVSGNEPQMRNRHKRFQGRDGRVRFRQRVIKRIGDIDFVNGQYVPQTAFNRYKAKHQKRVGNLKAGWLPAAKRFKAKPPPAYVQRQASRSGRAIDAMGRNGSGFLSAINTVPYNSKLGKMIRATIQKRTGDLTTWLAVRMEKVIEKENRRKVA